MPNTYSQIYLQFVFAVKFRKCLIPKEHKEELHKYITGLVKNRDAEMLAVHCMPDHVHLFVAFKPTVLIANFIKEVNVEATEFINTKRWMAKRFRWQNGYGVFSYGRREVQMVIDYVHNQEEHHRTKSFKREYIDMLKEFEISFDEKYVFEFF
jgi:REP element-mobilizing transposase RayT